MIKLSNFKFLLFLLVFFHSTQLPGQTGGRATNNVEVGFEDFYGALPDYKKCITILEEIKCKAEVDKDIGRYARASDLMGWSYKNLKNYNAALHFYEVALEKSLTINDSVGIANVYNHLYNVHKIMGNYDRALQYLLNSYEIYSEVGSTEKIAISLMNLGSIYFFLKDYENSEFYSFKALEYSNYQNEKKWRSSIYGNLIALFNETNQFHLIDSVYNTMSRTNLESENNNTYVADYNYAVSLKKRKNFERSRVVLQKTLRSLRKIKDERFEAISHITLGSVNIYLEDYDSALVHLERGQDIAMRINDRDIKSKCYQNFAWYYEVTKDYKKAFLYKDKFQQLNDSLYSEDILKNVQEIHLAQQKLKSDAIIAEKEATIRQKEKFVQMASIIGLLSIALVVSVSKSYAVIRKQNRIIKEKNESLNVQNEKINSALSNSENMLNEFIYRTSHDINGPLSSLKGLAYLAEKDNLDEKSVEYFQRFKTSLSQMENVLTNWQELSKVRYHQITYKSVPLERMIRNCVEHNIGKYPSEKISLHLNIETENVVNTDPFLLECMLSRLIDNAMKFRSSGNEHHNVEVNISEADGHLIVSISDNGIGIEDKNINSVFDLFVRISEKNPSGGTGLFIAKMAADKLSGHIDVKSDPDIPRTTFLVTFPL